MSYEKNNSLSIYFKKRFLAIYPQFWISYIIAFCFITLYNKQAPLQYPPYTYIFSFLGIDGLILPIIPNNYLLGEWFLGFIIITYIIFPILYTAYKKNWIITISITLCLSLLFYINNVYFYDIPYPRIPFTRLFEFCLGMLIYKTYKMKYFKYTSVFCFIFLIFYIIFDYFYIPFFLRTIIFCPIIFIILIQAGNFIEKLPFNKLFSILGKYSYGAFLIHHILLDIFFIGSDDIDKITKYTLFFTAIVIIYILSAQITKFTGWLINYIKSSLFKEKSTA